MTVTKAVEPVMQLITELRSEMRQGIHDLRFEMQRDIHELRDGMNIRFSTLENDVTSIKTRLSIIEKTQDEIRSKLIDYTFRAGWLLLGAAVSYFVLHLHNLIH